MVEKIDALNDIMKSKVNVQVFALLQTADVKHLARFQITGEALIAIRETVIKAVKNFLKTKEDDDKLYSLSDYDDKLCHHYFHVLDRDDDKIVSQFNYLDDPPQKATNSDSISQSIKGYFFKIESLKGSFWAYQNMSTACVTNSKSSVKLFGGSLELIKGKIFQFGENISFIFQDYEIIFKKINILQDLFGFDLLISRKANETLDKIEQCDYVDDLSKVRDYYNKNPKCVGKKFMRIMDTGILDLPKEILKENISSVEYYSSKFEFDDEGRIIIKNRKNVTDLIKMFNDPVARSVLTGQVGLTNGLSKLD